ncbi:MAG: hypothetical protein GWN84_24500 [Gammaproteobacteria bacterium]|nr:hypothetical protein [Gammaproteobacteria bacterium]NIR85746.1 hypothetical protein [Gammaproteobacteria bacterium]NIR90279.1 hypothetical protein [Gammaproteobacteria bacterium]NIU06880.1 hypothetical protein [Gammaproteobacteria bacterium]NIV53813.1 hypothetical protein [Gammaproteobacteria bacterium]
MILRRPVIAVIASLALVASFVSVGASAQAFDGSQPLLCASVDTIGCGPGEGCAANTAEDLNVPRFLRIDFDKGLVRTSRSNTEERMTQIQSVKRDENGLILQGVEGGYGWSMVITQATGKMALSVAGDGAAFVVFGACTLLD